MSVGAGKRFIYQLIYTSPEVEKSRSPYGRSPTLETVLMVEKEILDTSGEFGRTEIWKRLPKKVMWQTYLVVLEYLESTGRIAFDRVGHVAYIWNPKLARKYLSRPELGAR
jgi:hypothetical protein